jgi:hypothetical protein
MVPKSPEATREPHKFSAFNIVRYAVAQTVIKTTQARGTN